MTTGPNPRPDPPVPAPPPPAPPHTPLVDRVAALEDRLTQLSSQYNKAVDDFARELGLI
jgi:hypothetical protein